MKRLFLTVGCATVAGAASMALGVGSGHADTSNSTLNVIGEPYAKAVAILRAQGVKATFGGSVGSDVPQAQCIVATEKVVAGHIQLSLDCTAEAQPEQPGGGGTTSVGASGTNASGAPASETARPTPGAPGVVTVVPTRVG